jgi:colanic acid biosynthesis protein WcaH
LRLSESQFRNIIRDTILVSLDLLILDSNGQILLGKRKNAPAKGYFFVPGGRIFKGESPQVALTRIAQTELGLQISPLDATLHGIYRHSYDENCFGAPEVGGTEYLVIACRLRLAGTPQLVFDQQHEEMRFFSIEDTLRNPEVHEYTKAYFQPDPPNAFLKYGFPAHNI